MKERRDTVEVYTRFLNVPRHVMKLRQTPPLLFVYLNRDRARAKRNEFGEESVGPSETVCFECFFVFLFSRLGKHLVWLFLCINRGQLSGATTRFRFFDGGLVSVLVGEAALGISYFPSPGYQRYTWPHSISATHRA